MQSYGDFVNYASETVIFLVLRRKKVQIEAFHAMFAMSAWNFYGIYSLKAPQCGHKPLLCKAWPQLPQRYEAWL